MIWCRSRKRVSFARALNRPINCPACIGDEQRPILELLVSADSIHLHEQSMCENDWHFLASLIVVSSTAPLIHYSVE